MIINESFWVGAAVVTFVAFVWRVIARAIAGGLDHRTDRIQKELEEALSLKEEAQAMLAEYQRKQHKAAEEADAIIQHAEEEVERILKDGAELLKQDLQKRSDMAMQKIAQAEAAVVKEIRENAVDITIGAARKVIAEHLSNAQDDALLESSVKELDRKFH